MVSERVLKFRIIKNKIKFFLVIGPFFITSICSSQVKDSLKNNSTKLAKAQIAVGKIVKKEYFDFLKFENKGVLIYAEGDCYDINFQLLKVTDAATQLEVNGIYISATCRSGSGNYSYIDEDEIPALIKFLELVLKVTTLNSETQVEYIFNSNDLKLFCANEMATKKGKENKWKCVIDLDKYFSGGSYYFKNDEVSILLNKLKELVK